MWTEGGRAWTGVPGVAVLFAFLLACIAAGVEAGTLPAASAGPGPAVTALSQASGVAAASDMADALATAFSRPAPATVEPGDAAALEFARDPAVTRREQDAAVAHFRRAGGGKAGAVERGIRSGATLREFDRLLQRNGYSPTNLGDVLAAYVVLSWEVVNDRDATHTPAGMRAVRRQLAGPLASMASVAAMDPAARQAQAERTAYLALAAVAAHRALKSGSDPAQLASLRSNVRRSFLRSGLDLSRLDLTADGLLTR